MSAPSPSTTVGLSSRKRSHGGVIASRFSGSPKNANASTTGSGTTCERSSRRIPAGVGAFVSTMVAMTESVWDYPRPPRIEASARRVRVVLGGGIVAETARAHRVLETSHPPVYYVPFEDVAAGALEPSAARTTFCEWKGSASYFDAIGADGRRVERAAWTYRDPSPGFEAIR